MKTVLYINIRELLMRIKVISERLTDLFRRFRKQLKWRGVRYPYRKYNSTHECIFIHIPKTAGTSILRTLIGKSAYRNHTSYHEFQRVDAVKFENYFKFCFVRNPYDRVVSSYVYLIKGGNKKEDLDFQNFLKENFPTFEKFILEYLDKDTIYDHILFKPQYSFIYNYKRKCHVDYIGRYENIKIDFESICQKLNISCKLPSTNRVKRDDFETFYANNVVREKVYSLYQKDFELFNYSKISIDSAPKSQF